MNESNIKRSAVSPSPSADYQLDKRLIWRFSPNQTEPKLLETISVGREPLLQYVLEKISDSAYSGSTHHVLLHGPRGIGKSHFIALLYHRLSMDEKLSEAVRIAWLNEDETTTSLTQLLVRLYRSLCQHYPDEFSSRWLDELLDQPTDEIAAILSRRLAKKFKQRKLIILVENLSSLFENLGAVGQHQLRTLLQEKPFVCLIATSQQLFKKVTDRNEPFFGFFQQIPLKPLALSEAQQLLIKVAKAKNQQDLVQFLSTADGRGRVKAIHDLAGGNHRVYIVLSGFITRDSLDELVITFQKMADELTPYYQERLRWLSPLQRQIIELLCRQHGTLNPKEIARRLLLDQRSIGKQIRVLEEIGYLNSNKRGRETYYELSEPLMRLVHEVKERSLMRMLVEFLRIWYRSDQIEQMRQANLSQTTQFYLHEAWERSQKDADPRLKLLQAELEKAKAENRKHELAELWEEKAAASNTAWDWWQAGFCHYSINFNFSRSLKCFANTLEIDPKFDKAWKGKAISLLNLGNFQDALLCVEKGIELSRDDATFCTIKGVALAGLNRNDEALDCYDKAIDSDPHSAIAWNNKGWALASSSRFEEALPCFDTFIEIKPKGPHAWYGKGAVLNKLNRHQEALYCFDKALQFDPELAEAWNGKGSSLQTLGHYQESLVCYEKASELDPTNSLFLFNRSESLFALNQWREGFETIRKALNMEYCLSNSLGDVATMFVLVFRHSQDQHQLDERICTLVDSYEQATRNRNHVESHQKLARVGSKLVDGAMPIRMSAASLNEGLLNPLSHLADGLVRSLGELDATAVPASALESYVSAVEKRVKNLTEFEISLRLFRYGARFLISGRESEFVELIQPERRILRQVFGLSPEQ